MLDLSCLYFNASPDIFDIFIVSLSNDMLIHCRPSLSPSSIDLDLPHLYFNTSPKLRVGICAYFIFQLRTLIHCRPSLSPSSIVLDLPRLYLNASLDISDTFIVLLTGDRICAYFIFPLLDSAR